MPDSGVARWQPHGIEGFKQFFIVTIQENLNGFLSPRPVNCRFSLPYPDLSFRVKSEKCLQLLPNVVVLGLAYFTHTEFCLSRPR